MDGKDLQKMHAQSNSPSTWKQKKNCMNNLIIIIQIIKIKLEMGDIRYPRSKSSSRASCLSIGD